MSTTVARAAERDGRAAWRDGELLLTPPFYDAFLFSLAFFSSVSISRERRNLGETESWSGGPWLALAAAISASPSLAVRESTTVYVSTSPPLCIVLVRD